MVDHPDLRFPADPRHPLLDPKSKTPLNVLLLEDNDMDAIVFEGAAKKCSQPLAIRRVASLAEFSSAMGEQLPDLICADHLLPDGHAADALAIRNQAIQDIPFVVITGAGEEDVAVDYMKSGATEYLSKRRMDEFSLAIDSVLKDYRNRALRHAAEQETKRLNAELLALIRHVEEERDDEKRSLSRDIHDQLGQELTALKLGLYMVQKGLPADESDEESTRLHGKVDELIELNTHIIHQVRNIARSLRPVVLDQVGLSAGIETLVRDFNRKGRTFCGLFMDPLPDLSDAMRTDLFRIVQEALTNIQRHADAELAYVRLFHEEQGIRLEIGDNGRGMPTPQDGEIKPTGLGMVGMRERVRNHNGRVTVQSTAGSGTSIEVNIPLNGNP